MTRSRAALSALRLRALLDAPTLPRAPAPRSYDLTPSERREAVADAETLLASAVARQAEHEASGGRARRPTARR